MPAIRKPKTPPLTPPPRQTLIGAKANQPPPFRATGQGYFNRLPDFPANEKRANGSLINHATAKTHPLYKIYLYVDAVESGWQLSGNTTQAQTSRSFYPQNMSQDELMIYGSVPNQYEYDRLVEFTLHHHLSQFNPSSITAQTLDGNGNYPGVDFKLFRPQTGSSTNAAPPMHYSMVITDISAGHQRFMNFPTWQMTCKVTYDHLQQDETVDQAVAYWTTVKDVYGNVVPPVMSTGKDSKTGSQQNPKKKKS